MLRTEKIKKEENCAEGGDDDFPQNEQKTINENSVKWNVKMDNEIRIAEK